MLLLLLLLLLCLGRRPHNLVHVAAELRQRRPYLSRQRIAELRKGAALAGAQLVCAANELDKLARVNVWVATGLDVLHKITRDGRQPGTCAVDAAIATATATASLLGYLVDVAEGL